MYNNMSELLNIAQERGVLLSQIVLENEMDTSQLSEEQIYSRLRERYEVMVSSAHKALDQPFHAVGSLIEGQAMTQHNYSNTENTLCGKFLNKVMAMALSCSEMNASMGKICAAPTAGACGIIPAVIISVAEHRNCNEKQILDGLLIASGIGSIITKNATVSGAEGGCQAECGVAAAMAAGAAVQMSGGTSEMVINASAFAIMNVLGLICDPVAGLVQVPCAQRNASQAINAMLCADMALAGLKSIIPLDEIIEAMYRVGKMLPYQLRETAMGGVAATPTAKAIYNKIFMGSDGNDK